MDNIITETTRIVKLGVCEGRHPLPVDAYVFGNKISEELLVNPEALQELALKVLGEKVQAYYYCDNCGGGMLPVGQATYYCPFCESNHIHGWWFEVGIKPVDKVEVEEVNLYVTGLTVAVIAIVNAAKVLKIPITLWHFDKNSGEYFPQKVI